MKASGKQIAARYAKALFDVAGAADLAQVENNIQALSVLYAQSAPFRGVIANPLLTRAELAKAMYAVLAHISAHKMTHQFVTLLAEKKRLSLLPDIAEAFLKLAARERGEVSAEVVSAAPLSAADVKSIGDRLGKAYGRNIQLSARVNPALLGGVVIKIGSQQLDSSLSGKLRRLSHKLKAA